MSLRKILWTVLVLASMTMKLVSGAEGVTYAERLGWPAGTRVVLFHVDDAGMSYDSNRGAILALEGGIATSASVMMPCPWVPQFAAYLKEHPEVDAGLHLTLNAEWKDYRWGPVAGKPAVPGLVDEQGCLWDDVADVARHASAQEFETEIRAQIDKALTMGLHPTHLDTHMGTCFQQPFTERYIRVGIELGIPILVIGGHMQYLSAEYGQFKPLIQLLAEGVWKAGLPVIDDLVTQPTKGPAYEQRKQELFRLLRDMKPGVTQIIVHCTAPTEVFRHISGSGPAREAELRLMTDPEVRTFIADQGIVLTTWRELKQRRDAADGASCQP
ncbi:MAG: polysaccharide deacetylase family protein [Sedimentisphaerales bacterium]|nr:polysaccharide deacetylase family protein [Sedimentisphaerales bacterium]